MDDITGASQSIQHYYCEKNTTYDLTQAHITFRLDAVAEPVENTCFCLLFINDVTQSVEVSVFDPSVASGNTETFEWSDVNAEPEEVTALKLFYSKLSQQHLLALKTSNDDVMREISEAQNLRLTPSTISDRYIHVNNVLSIHRNGLFF